jgi:hypothetical protein
LVVKIENRIALMIGCDCDVKLYLYLPIIYYFLLKMSSFFIKRLRKRKPLSGMLKGWDLLAPPYWAASELSNSI